MALILLLACLLVGVLTSVAVRDWGTVLVVNNSASETRSPFHLHMTVESIKDLHPSSKVSWLAVSCCNGKRTDFAKREPHSSSVEWKDDQQRVIDIRGDMTWVGFTVREIDDPNDPGAPTSILFTREVNFLETTFWKTKSFKTGTPSAVEASEEAFSSLPSFMKASKGALSNASQATGTIHLSVERKTGPAPAPAQPPTEAAGGAAATAGAGGAAATASNSTPAAEGESSAGVAAGSNATPSHGGAAAAAGGNAKAHSKNVASPASSDVKAGKAGGHPATAAARGWAPKGKTKVNAHPKSVASPASSDVTAGKAGGHPATAAARGRAPKGKTKVKAHPKSVASPASPDVKAGKAGGHLATADAAVGRSRAPLKSRPAATSLTGTTTRPPWRNHW